MNNRLNKRALAWVRSAGFPLAVVFSLLCSAEPALAQRSPKPPAQTPRGPVVTTGPVPGQVGGAQAATAQQKTPSAVTELNKIPVRVPFYAQDTKAKLEAALAGFDKSGQKLKAAVVAMLAYHEKEGTCLTKTWTAADMDKQCLPQDTLKQCKEKLLAACAAGGGPNKTQLWSNVQSAGKEVGQAVNGINQAETSGLPYLPPAF